jgi:hypothetical protein
VGTRADRSFTRGLKSTGHTSRVIENPLPHIQEARGAANRIVSLQRELFTLKAEHLAIAQAKRIGYAIAAILSAFLGILFFFGWFDYFLHEKGVNALWLALGMLVLFASLSAWGVWAAWSTEKS